MDRNQKIIRTSRIGILTNAGLAVVKILIGFAAGSVSILNDGINNFTDTLSSVLTLVGTRLSVRRPDRKHPYGYGRIEYLTALGVSFIISYAGISTFKAAVESIIAGRTAQYSIPGLIILAAALVVKLLLGLYFRRVGKETESKALIGSGTDSLSDCVVSAAAVAGALLNRLLGIRIEGWMALIIALFVIKSGAHLLIDSLNILIGERENSDFIRQLREEVLRYPEVLGVYDVIMNDYGNGRKIGSLHIELADETPAVTIHRLTRRIIREMFDKYGVILTVGIYASNTADPAACAVFDEILEIQKKHTGITQIHGFYVDWEQEVISFDLVVDFRYDGPEISRSICRELSKNHPGCRIDIVLDTDFG